MRTPEAAPGTRRLAGKVMRGMVFLGLLGSIVLSAWGQDEAKPEVTFSYDGKSQHPLALDRGGVALRPNLSQLAYFHYTNPGPKGKKLVVKLLTTRKNRPDLEFATAELEVLAGETRIIGPWKVSPALIKPAPPPPPPGTTPPPAPVPPVVVSLADLEGPAFEILLEINDGQTRSKVKVPIDILIPTEYTEVTERKSANTRLMVKIKSKNADNFRGGPCPIQFTISSPFQTEAVLKDGVLRQVIEGPDQEVTLLADNLRLARDTQFYLAVDGYQRGYIYTIDTIGTDPTLRLDKELRLYVSPFLKAAEKVRVRIETDNLTSKEDVTIHLALLRDGEKIKDRVLVGPREQQVRLQTPEPDGALVFQTVSRDWEVDLDVGDVLGRYALEGSLTYRAGDDLRTLKTNPPRIGIILDDSPPGDVRFLTPTRLQKVIRGKPLTIKARGNEGLTDFAEVLFFLGKPTADHKPPPNAVPVKGVRKNPRERIWEPEEPLLPADAKGRVDLGVVFVSKAGLSSSATQLVEVVEPDPPGKKAEKSKLATIIVSVREGDRPQNGMPVELRDDKGILKLKGTSAPVKNKEGVEEPGKIVFKDLPPGAYRVSAAKSASQTKGSKDVVVTEGEEKPVDIPLYR